MDEDARLYSELRALIDGGSESGTHADAMRAVQRWKDAYFHTTALDELAREGQERGECALSKRPTFAEALPEAIKNARRIEGNTIVISMLDALADVVNEALAMSRDGES